LEHSIHIITTKEQLATLCQKWKSLPEIAVDLEFDDNRHYYGRQIGLIQIFDGQAAYLVDVVATGRPDSLQEVFGDSKVAKVFHSCKGDLIMMDELYGWQCRNIYDTSQMYKLATGTSGDIGLQKLLMDKLGIASDKQKQTSDWIFRPLSREQIQYAARDVIYLPELRELLEKELEGLGRASWLEEDRKSLEEVKAESNGKYPRIPKKAGLSPRQSLLFYGFWEIADQLAASLNKPNYKVIHNKVLLELAKSPPRTPQAWKAIRECHPALKSNASIQKLMEVVENINRLQVNEAAKMLPKGPKSIMVGGDLPQATLEKRKGLVKIMEDNADTFETIDLKAMVLSNRIKEKLIFEGDSCLKKWQEELLKEYCQENGWDYSVFHSR
jgi:ribonuclease D